MLNINKGRSILSPSSPQPPLQTIPVTFKRDLGALPLQFLKIFAVGEF